MSAQTLLATRISSRVRLLGATIARVGGISWRGRKIHHTLLCKYTVPWARKVYLRPSEFRLRAPVAAAMRTPSGLWRDEHLRVQCTKQTG